MWQLHWQPMDSADALKYLRRAVDADPSYAEAIHLIGDLIVDFDPERAIAFYRKSLDLEPRMQVNYPDMALAFLSMNQLEAAEQAAAARPAEHAWARLVARVHRSSSAVVRTMRRNIALRS